MTVTKMGFVKCKADGFLLVKVKYEGTVILCIYVDDMLVLGNKSAVEMFKHEIKRYSAILQYKIGRSNGRIHQMQGNQEGK